MFGRCFSVLLLLAFFEMVRPAFAGLYPIITDVTTTRINFNTSEYRFKQQLVDIGALADMPAPPGSWTGLTHKHINYRGAAAQAQVTAQVGHVKVITGETIGQAAVRAYNSGAQGVNIMWHIGEQDTRECIGYMNGPQPISPWDSVIMPVGSCVFVPPAEQFCNISSPSVSLEHGILTLGMGDSTASYDMSLICTAPMKIRISFGQDVVLLSNGLRSKLAVPAAVNGFVSMLAGTNKTEITSTINVPKNAKTGQFSGSSVVYIEYY
ncbi:hypothetical protein ACTVNX_03680 [Serratia nevei]|uniref:hypothetical protein n=1 Tax=Serratia TaxID=613 RepID=UPI0018D927E5|nr:hypothetical protein [Serratia marcescens]MBI6126332.1 hypothetical protein [Serratia marcescens]MBN5301069.1 hypothetical protein [Serratia marcescens]MDU6300342.1 hypothetical protein [Serratia marcescens]